MARADGVPRCHDLGLSVEQRLGQRMRVGSVVGEVECGFESDGDYQRINAPLGRLTISVVW